MPEPLLRCTDVEMTYGETLALSPTSLAIGEGESVAVMGPSGSGKTTLLQCIEGLITPSGGQVDVLGQDQRVSSRAQRAALRRRSMGLVFQDPELLPEFSTVENVAFGLLFDGVPRAQALQRAREALTDVGLADRADAEVRTLSGGEAQRVALARALVRPELRLVIADEPTAALDVDTAQLITTILLEHARARGAAVLLATHDPAVAARCDRIHRVTRQTAAA